jgi:hypothetical protein
VRCLPTSLARECVWRHNPLCAEEEWSHREQNDCDVSRTHKFLLVTETPAQRARKTVNQYAAGRIETASASITCLCRALAPAAIIACAARARGRHTRYLGRCRTSAVFAPRMRSTRSPRTRAHGTGSYRASRGPVLRAGLRSQRMQYETQTRLRREFHDSQASLGTLGLAENAHAEASSLEEAVEPSSVRASWVP